jgi:glycosyltransferase involved in cell wall biosynthesis
VIAVTEGIRAQLVANGAAQPDQVSVIPYGVELGVFGTVSRPQPARNGSRTVIFTGNLAPYQGIELMLEAFRTVRARRPDVRLVIATEDDFERYERRAADLGVRPFIDVLRVGFADVPALLSDAEVALNPRVACDGLPQKLVNGENAMVVADYDTDAFAAAIERLLADDALATRLGEAGRKLVHETLTWSSAAERIENVYRGLV